MQQPPPVRSVEAFGGRLHLLRREAAVRNGAEGAGRLVAQHARTTANLFCRDRRPYGILNRGEFSRSKNQVPQTRKCGNRDCAFWEAEDERAWREITILIFVEI